MIISASAIWIILSCCLADDVRFNFEINRNPKFLRESNNSNEETTPILFVPTTKKMLMLFDLGAFEAHPQPLPTRKPNPVKAIPSPYKIVYHGKRKLGDKRVYNNKFSYPPSRHGHHVIFKEFFNCTISLVVAEADAGIPIILQGGSTYNYFMVVIKGGVGVPLEGNVRAYCKIPKIK